MALVIYWNDFIRFGIVGVSILASLWVLWRHELANTRKDGNTAYENLLVPRSDTDGYAQAIPRNHVSSSQLWTSCWKGVHPGWLMATRLVSFLILAVFLWWDIMDSGVNVFVYYSGWTYALLMVYFAIGTAMSAYGCWVSTLKTLVEDEASAELLRRVLKEIGTTNSITYRRIKEMCTVKFQSQYAENALSLRAGLWGYLMQAVYQTSAGAVILADLLFWCIMVPFSSKEQLTLNMVMTCMHTFNALFLLLDTTLNSLPFPWFRLAYFVIWGCTYCIFQWVIHACGFTWWPYPFLELGISWSPYWYLVLVVLHVPCYGIYALIVKAKYSLFPKWFPKAFATPDMIKHAKE